MENWKNIQGFEGLYQVSDLGKVKSLTRKVVTSKGIRTYQGKILKPSLSVGYKKVILTSPTKRRQVKIHQLVAEAFLNYTATKGFHIDHINDDRFDNRLCNLRIISHGDNVSKHIKGKIPKSGYRHIYKAKRGKPWTVNLSLKGKKYNLGAYNTIEEAIQVRDNFLITK